MFGLFEVSKGHVYALLACVSGAIGNATFLVDPDELTRVGISGIMLLLAALFYKLFQDSMKKREEDHRKYVDHLLQEIKELRRALDESKRDKR